MKQILLFLFSLPLVISAQPEFSFDLYFEDALGNRDTITLGYDPLASDSIDVEFGEENTISQPWDSVFEVRITDKMQSVMYGNPQQETFRTKKQIIKNQCQENWVPWNLIYFDVKNVTFPFTISWNEGVFQNDCIIGSMIQNIEVNSWFDIGWFGGYLSHAPNPLMYDSLGVNHGLEMKYLDTDNKPVYSFWFMFGDSTRLTLNSPTLGENLPIVIPNPFNEVFEIQDENELSELKLFDLQGRAVDFERNGKEIRVLNHEQGLLFLSYKLAGNTYRTKIIKHE